MRPRRNPFVQISHSLARSGSSIEMGGPWFKGLNRVLIDRGVFVRTNPLQSVTCPICDGTATVLRGGRSASCGECGNLFATDRMDLSLYRFSHAGMAALMQSELHLTHHQQKDGYDCFRAPNGRSVYYIHREAEVDRSRLMGESDPYLVYGSADPAPLTRNDPAGMELATIDSVFEVREDGVIWTCRRALDLTESHNRSAAILTEKNRAQKIRRTLLAKALLAAVRRLARLDEDRGRSHARDWHQFFADRLAKMNKECVAGYKTIEGDVKALSGNDGDFSRCWDALVAGRVEMARTALRKLASEDGGGREADPDSLMRWNAKQRADGGYADEEVDFKSSLHYGDDESFYADIDRDLGLSV